MPRWDRRSWARCRGARSCKKQLNIITKPSTAQEDRKSTRLNSSHGYISYAVFCLKKKKLRQSHRPGCDLTVVVRPSPGRRLRCGDVIALPLPSGFSTDKCGSTTPLRAHRRDLQVL